MWRLWSRLTEIAPIGLSVGLVAVLVFPKLPPGICFGDSGGLQLAAATLGITHPPGYSGYVSFAYLFTFLPWAEPAFGVTLVCFLAGLSVIALVALTQVELGVNAWVAAAAALLLTGHPRVWSGLIAPEVYMPTLALLAGAAYLLILYARDGRNRFLWVSALLFGAALANRPPVLLLIPFFVSGWVACLHGRSPGRHVLRGKHAYPRPGRVKAFRPPTVTSARPVGSFAIAALIATLPSVYSLTYLWVRDGVETPYNYIEEYNAEFGSLPPYSAGWHAKLERVVWEITARQFWSNVNVDLTGVRSRLRWLGNRLLPRPVSVFIGAMLVCGGAALAWRRSRAGCIVLVGLGLASAAFVCVYRVYGTAADFLPLLHASAVFSGVAISLLVPRTATGWRRGAGILVLVLAGAWTVFDASGRRATNADATGFLRKVDLATLPPGAVICTNWDHAAPLRYAKCVSPGRKDVHIINASSSAWRRLVKPMGDRPVFAVRPSSAWPKKAWEPYRNLWRLRRAVSVGPGGGVAGCHMRFDGL